MTRVLAATIVLAAPATALRAAEMGSDLLGESGDFTLAPPELGEDAAHGWYFTASGGYVLPSSGTLSVNGWPVASGTTGSSGWSVGGGLGYRFADWLRAEASIDYLALGSAGSALGSLETRATVGLASLYWDMVTLSGFTPYVGGGVGFSIDSLDAGGLLPSSGNDWRFAWALAAGVSYALSSAWTADLGYRYVDLGTPEFSGPEFAGPQLARIDNLAAHQIRFALRYHFGE